MVFKHYGMTALAAVLAAGMAGGAWAQDTTVPPAATEPGAVGTTPPTGAPMEATPVDPAVEPGTTGARGTVDGGGIVDDYGTTGTYDAAGTTAANTAVGTPSEAVTPTAARDDDGGMDLGWLGLIGLAGLLGLRGRHEEHIRNDMGRPTTTR